MRKSSSPKLRLQAASLPILLAMLLAGRAGADVGDLQVGTDHPWYPGELACSTFERLAATEAECYRRVTGRDCASDEDKALAAWLWRNTHFYHGEEGAQNLWGGGFAAGGDLRTREYWTGLFAHGFGLCGTTHSQWTAEMEYLLEHARGRGVGVSAHNAFEVWLTGGAYEDGRWALLDHDVSTVIFNDTGNRLLSIAEVGADLKRWTDRRYRPEKQHGWLVCGLHEGDGDGYKEFNVAEYLAGYAGPPPKVRLRRGEVLRRYLEPGLEDGRTFVFWGRNYRQGGVPGPERSLTWVNQPDRMYGSTSGPEPRSGQARYGNALYLYQPDFTTGDYQEGLVRESEREVVFEFVSPYIIGATPPNDKPWGIYDAGGRNGLVVDGRGDCLVSVSVDHGRVWIDAGRLRPGIDLTDAVKGHQQYWLRFGAGASNLAGSNIRIRTVCQANAAVLPRLSEGDCMVRAWRGDHGVFSAGPERDLAQSHIVDGAFGSPGVTLELQSPRNSSTVALYAAAHTASGNPPDPTVRFQIEYSIDQGSTWAPVVKDWRIPRRGIEPADYWSQSFCYGSISLPREVRGPIRVRFANSARRIIQRAEAHLVYRTVSKDKARVTLHWTHAGGQGEATFVCGPGENPASRMVTGQEVRTRWIEFRVDPAR